jgi:DNA-binding NarL/FixJ family response regulator
MPRNGGRVLFIDSSPRLHRDLPRIVRYAGLDFAHATRLAVASRQLTTEHFDLVVTDLRFPDGDGVAFIERVAQLRPGLPVLVLSDAASQERIVAAIRAGATGHVLKEQARVRLGEAIVEALAGGAPLSPIAARAVLDAIRATSAGPGTRRSAPIESPGYGGLSPRERQVVTALGRGLSYAEVATELGVSLNTVRAHVRTLYEKLGAASKTEAVMAALRLGLFPAGDGPTPV